MKIALINPYELGRQPFALAQLAAWLRASDHQVCCLDLSLQPLGRDSLCDADVVAVYVGMHTATRIAIEAMPRIREYAPRAHISVYGLYAPMNEGLFRSLGAKSVFGGEVEPQLVSLVDQLSRGELPPQTEAQIDLAKIAFKVPDRSLLPDISRYAHLRLGNGVTRVVGFVEGTRGCKHLCRHCPVVPIYQGKFRVVPVEVVIADIRQQVAAGAEHVSFGDPDFFNGPAHALRLVKALHDEFPNLTYDATIKVEHLIKLQHLLPILKETGCLFVVSAVEAVDDVILTQLAKGHTRDDFSAAVRLLRGVDIAFAPTFVAFTPWTTRRGYVDLLSSLVSLRLVESVPPIQLAIRLLIPQGSYLLRAPGFLDLIEDYDPKLLGYPWKHVDPAMDDLQRRIQDWVALAEREGRDRQSVFVQIWSWAHEVLGQPVPALPNELGNPIPHMSEPWYCCAEPTTEQLQQF